MAICWKRYFTSLFFKSCCGSGCSLNLNKSRIQSEKSLATPDYFSHILGKCWKHGILFCMFGHSIHIWRILHENFCGGCWCWRTVRPDIRAASSEFGTYRLCKERRFSRACSSAQSRQNLRCSLIQAVSQEEPSDRKPDPWTFWIAGHAQSLSWWNARRHKFAWRGSYCKGTLSKIALSPYVSRMSTITSMCKTSLWNGGKDKLLSLTHFHSSKAWLSLEKKLVHDIHSYCRQSLYDYGRFTLLFRFSLAKLFWWRN